MAKNIDGSGSDALRLTQQQRDALLTAFQLGAGVRDASAYAGLSERTVHHWITMGKRDGEASVYADLFNEIEAARSTGIVHSLGVMYEEKDWRAHEKRVKMLRPDEYSESRLEQTVTVNHYVHISPEAMRKLADDEIDVLERLVEKMQADVVQGELVAESDGG